MNQERGRPPPPPPPPAGGGSGASSRRPLPRLRSRGRIAPEPQQPTGPDGLPERPRPRWGRRLLLLAALLGGAAVLGWGSLREAAPEQAAAMEETLGGWKAAATERWTSFRDQTWPSWRERWAATWEGWTTSPDAPPPGPGSEEDPAPRPPPPRVLVDPGDPPRFAELPGADLPPDWNLEYGVTYEGTPPSPSPEGAPRVVPPDGAGGLARAAAEGVLIAGPEGSVLRLPSGLRLDLGPGARYAREGAGLRLLEGRALLEFPAGGATLALGPEVRVEGRDAAAEVWVEGSGAGTVDLLAGDLSVLPPDGPPRPLAALERYDLEYRDVEPVPAAQLETFVKRQVWFLSGQNAPRAGRTASAWTERALEATAGTAREGLARRARAAVRGWVRGT